MFRIKSICKEQGITLKELAAKIGITEVGLRKSLAGNPTIKTLGKIADALGVSIADLLPDSAGSIKAVCPHCGKPLSIEITRPNDSP